MSAAKDAPVEQLTPGQARALVTLLRRDQALLVATLRGCRDALQRVPEQLRGVSDSMINRQLRRAEATLEQVVP